MIVQGTYPMCRPGSVQHVHTAAISCRFVLSARSRSNATNTIAGRLESYRSPSAPV